MILLIDNYDSFVFNLARYLGELGARRRVVRNDALTVEEALAMQPTAILLSPGPKAPDQAGICLDLVRAASGRVPLLGICLGHQAIVQALGGQVRRAARPRHGLASPCNHGGDGLFFGLPSPFDVGRYHSLVAEPAPGGPLRVKARAADDGEVMAVAHDRHPTWGLQFHPESVLTRHGQALLGNFLRLSRAWQPDLP